MMKSVSKALLGVGGDKVMSYLRLDLRGGLSRGNLNLGLVDDGGGDSLGWSRHYWRETLKTND